jgi:hypothetical protein
MGGSPGSRNLISGNGGDGVEIASGFGSHVRVGGNFIGTDPTGRMPLGNRRHGVYLGAGRRNEIGGATPRTGNTIAFNEGNGINIATGTSDPEGQIRSNRIFANAGQAIARSEESNFS